MSSWLLSVLRTGVQALVGLLVTFATAHGLNIPLGVQGVFAQTLTAIAVAAAVTAVTAGLRWLESRTGADFWSRAARLVVKILMLGLAGKTPVYIDATKAPKLATPAAPAAGQLPPTK